MFHYTAYVHELSNDTLQQFMREIFLRNLTNGQMGPDSAILNYLADKHNIPLGDFEKVCMAEFIWRGLTLDKSALDFPEHAPGSDTYDYLTDEDLLSVRERN
ncbi:hypothetical protein ACWOEH_08960 [Enterococcus nangangensis]